MITVNSIQVNQNLDNLTVDVMSTLGCPITQILFWDIDTYRSTTDAIDLSSLLTNGGLQENFNIVPTDVGKEDFSSVYFIEFISAACPAQNVGCGDGSYTFPVGNISKFYECLLNLIFNIEISDCGTISKEDLGKSSNCDGSTASDKEGCTPDVNLVSTLISGLEKALKMGYYEQAIKIMKKLDDICGDKCSCSGLTYTPIGGGNTNIEVENNVIIQV